MYHLSWHEKHLKLHVLIYPKRSKIVRPAMRPNLKFLIQSNHCTAICALFAAFEWLLGAPARILVHKFCSLFQILGGISVCRFMRYNIYCIWAALGGYSSLVARTQVWSESNGDRLRKNTINWFKWLYFVVDRNQMVLICGRSTTK